MDKNIKKSSLKNKYSHKLAKFILNTRYGYEHLGLRENENDSDKRVPFPGLMLLSIRVSQLGKIINAKDKLSSQNAKNTLNALEKSIEEELTNLKKEENVVDDLLKSDINILHSTSTDERWKKTYEIPCNSQLVWKAIRLLILYDTIVHKYLNLWNTAGIEKEVCFLRINKCSAIIRRLFESFNIEAKKVIYLTKEDATQ